MVWTRRRERERAYSELIPLLEGLRDHVREGKPISEAHRELEAFLASQGELLTEGSRNGSRWFLDDVARGFGDEQRLDLIRRHADQFAPWATRVQRRWFTERRRWTLRFLIWLGLATLSVLVGFVAVEWFGISNLGPRLWETGPLSVIGYVIIGAPHLIVAGIGLFVLAYVLLGVVTVLYWAIALPTRVAGWVLGTGLLGIAGYALVVGFLILMVAILSWLGGFTVGGFMFWLGALAAWAYLAFFGGAAGAFGLAMGASLLAHLFGDRIPDPLDHSKIANGLIGIGYIVGSAITWGVFVAEDVALEAQLAGIIWGNPWLVLVVVHLYVAAWAGLWRTTQLVRRRAGLLPRLGPGRVVWHRGGAAPSHLVWHEGGPVPSKPRDEYWSPSPIVGWRSWDWDSGVLKGHYGGEWATPEMSASCDLGHAAPKWRCNCGIYALKAPPRGGSIVGQVELTGLVIEHEDGYRAEKAGIVALWVTTDDLGVVAAIRSRYPTVDVSGSPPPMIAEPEDTA